MKGIISKDGFIETKNNKKYQVCIADIENIIELQDKSLIDCEVEFEILNGIPRNIFICFENNKNNIIIENNKQRNNSLKHIYKMIMNYFRVKQQKVDEYNYIKDIKLFRNRIKIMLFCTILSPLVFPIIVVLVMKYKITKQIASVSDMKLLSLFWLSFVNIAIIYIILLFSISNIKYQSFYIFILFDIIFALVATYMYFRKLSLVTENKTFTNIFWGVFLSLFILRYSIVLGIIIIILLVIAYYQALFKITKVKNIDKDN